MGSCFLFLGSTKRWNWCGIHFYGPAVAASLLGTFAHANLELIFYKSPKQWKQDRRALLFRYCTIPEPLGCLHPCGLLLPLWSLLMEPGKHRGQEIKENSPLQPGLCWSGCSSAELSCCTWRWICSIDFSWTTSSSEDELSLRSCWGN